MLTEIAEGVYVRESEFIKSNTTVVRGRNGVLLVDPGITESELAGLADDLGELGQPVVAGFSTHPDWDHLLWHPRFGDAPRYGTGLCARSIRDQLASPDWEENLAGGLPPEHADEIPTHLLGLIEGLPVGTTLIPWDGPAVRIIEHRAHAPGHAALLVERSGVLVAGDMLSDILMPFLDLDAADPLGDYLAALTLFDGLADDVDAVVPGHGSVGLAGDVRQRIALDRAYVLAARDGAAFDDPRIGTAAPLAWLPDVHGWQLQRLAARERQVPPGA
jgi:glyoxylase-like metal-dependent hydrolase (beta-lactamase superfamily II)